MKDKILSIQSRIIYGYVGGNIADFAVQLHGLDVISFPTVLFSTHTGHPPVYGKATTKENFDELVAGIKNLDVLDTTAGIITGYMGSEDVLRSSYEFIKQIKEKYPDVLYVFDPVMGDVDRGFYVPNTVVEILISNLLPLCDIMTPNFFELEHILGGKIRTVADIKECLKVNNIIKDKILVATSCFLEDTPAGCIETIIIKGDNVERIQSQKVDIEATGTGDLFTSMLAAQMVNGKDISAAVKNTSDTISQCLSYIVEKGLTEMNAMCILKYVKP